MSNYWRKLALLWQMTSPLKGLALFIDWSLNILFSSTNRLHSVSLPTKILSSLLSAALLYSTLRWHTKASYFTVGTSVNSSIYVYVCVRICACACACVYTLECMYECVCISPSCSICSHWPLLVLDCTDSIAGSSPLLGAGCPLAIWIIVWYTVQHNISHIISYVLCSD